MVDVGMVCNGSALTNIDVDGSNTLGETDISFKDQLENTKISPHI